MLKTGDNTELAAATEPVLETTTVPAVLERDVRQYVQQHTQQHTQQHAQRYVQRNTLGLLLKRGAVPLSILLVLSITALFAPLLAPYPPAAQLDIETLKNLPPSLAHPFGTDPYSRDVLSRVMYGSRVSLAVAAFATALAITIGTVYGATAGYVGGRTDAMMMRLVDAMMAIPRVLLVLIIVALWQTSSLSLLVCVLGGTGWFTVSRQVRGQVLSLRTQDYVLAARSLGLPSARILWRHILPNVMPMIIVAATLGIGQVIVLEAGLSYLGMGVQPPDPSWGNIIQDGADQLRSLWWISVFPGVFIVTTAVAFNAFGDILRSVVDPRGTSFE